MENEILQDIFIRFSKALYLYALSLTHHPQDACQRRTDDLHERRCAEMDDRYEYPGL
ncbi:MAG: hypothetical protein IJ130_05000 [Solobacterium sp.]|nr:hypothetical protein [Solobacterium sp.]